MCKACEVIKTESAGRRPLSLTHPHLMDEWDFMKNGEVRPEYLTPGSRKKVHWCHKAEDGQIHEWKAVISSRTRVTNSSGCPYCKNKKVGYGNDLKSMRPEIAAEWHPTKNGSLKPEHVAPGAGLVAWWMHIRNGVIHEWRSSINNRTNQGHSRSCPYCENKKVGYGNDLLTHFPELCKEWHPTKNGDLKPEHFLPGSHKKVWWFHIINGVVHEWRASIHNRTKKNKPTKCPFCPKGPVSKISQKWLDSLDIQYLVREYYLKELRFIVDGFNPLTNTVYEFLGNYWHGNSDKYKPEDVNQHNKKSFGALNTETMNRLNLLKTKYNVIYIWEKDYLEGKPPTVLLQNTQSVLSI